ncbi:hypothetical protein IWZ00DRAFT_343220 [Phyllosticta capitalensis]
MLDIRIPGSILRSIPRYGGVSNSDVSFSLRCRGSGRRWCLGLSLGRVGVGIRGGCRRRSMSICLRVNAVFRAETHGAIARLLGIRVERGDAIARVIRRRGGGCLGRRRLLAVGGTGAFACLLLRRRIWFRLLSGSRSIGGSRSRSRSSSYSTGTGIGSSLLLILAKDLPQRPRPFISHQSGRVGCAFGFRERGACRSRRGREGVGGPIETADPVSILIPFPMLLLLVPQCRRHFSSVVISHSQGVG